MNRLSEIAICLRLAALLILVTCTMGCATPAPPPPVAVVSCLPLTSYTPDQQRALAKALDGLPADSPIIMAITDYGAMRASDRACMASAK